MKTQRTPRPPRLAQRLLAWYCRPELLEDLQGDLNEVFDRHCRTKGAFMARVIYFADAIKFCRTYTVRTPDLVNALTHWIMIGSYLRSASRNIARNKLFSAINIIGLSISMSVGLLLIGMLTDLLS